MFQPLRHTSSQTPNSEGGKDSYTREAEDRRREIDAANTEAYPRLTRSKENQKSIFTFIDQYHGLQDAQLHENRQITPIKGLLAECGIFDSLTLVSRGKDNVDSSSREQAGLYRYL